MPDEPTTPDPADVPEGMKRYILEEYERFPTLYADDGGWRGDPMGSEPAGFYSDDRVVILPVVVYEVWKRASEQLRAIEHMILEIESVQRRLEAIPPRDDPS